MTKKVALPETPIRILKIGNCPTLSGRSELTHHIGCNAEGDLHLRVVQNSGNGQFNSDWVPLSLIEKLLAGHPTDKPMNSACMASVFRGKSSNSPAFLFAVLKAEGIVVAGAEKDSGYLLGDIEGFKAQMSVLISSGTDCSAVSDTSSSRQQRKRPAKEAT